MYFLIGGIILWVKSITVVVQVNKKKKKRRIIVDVSIEKVKKVIANKTSQTSLLSGFNYVFIVDIIYIRWFR